MNTSFGQLRWRRAVRSDGHHVTLYDPTAPVARRWVGVGENFASAFRRACDAAMAAIMPTSDQVRNTITDETILDFQDAARFL